MAKKLVRKVKKVKRKYGQKQKQKQSQKVIINIGKTKPTKKRRTKPKPKPFISETLSTVLIQPQQPAFSTADLQTLLNSQRQTSTVGTLAQTAKTTLDQGTNTLNLMDEETIAVAEPAPRPTPRPTPRYEAEPLPSRPSRRYGLGTVKKQVWRERLISGVEERIAQEQKPPAPPRRYGLGRMKQAAFREVLISGVEDRIAQEQSLVIPQGTRQPTLGRMSSGDTQTPTTGRFSSNTRGVGDAWERAMLEQEIKIEDLKNYTEDDLQELREEGYDVPDEI